MSKKVVSFCKEEIRGYTAELATKKGRQVFQEKIEGVTPSVAAPGVTPPSDATANDHKIDTFTAHAPPMGLIIWVHCKTGHARSRRVNYNFINKY